MPNRLILAVHAEDSMFVKNYFFDYIDEASGERKIYLESLHHGKVYFDDFILS
jgi:hypothetical protein